MKKFRILWTGAGTPAWNMALDEAILEKVRVGESPPTIRFYFWDPPGLSLGYHQKAEREADPELLRAHGFELVRRPTGGRAVLHDGDLTYSVVAVDEERFAGGVQAAYREISMALCDGLRFLGIEAGLEMATESSDSQRNPANPCFSSAVNAELCVTGKKIVGSAQLRTGGVLLQHGAILLRKDQRGVADLIPGLTEPVRNRLRDKLARGTICIDDLLGREVDFADAVDAMVRGFQERWGESSLENATNWGVPSGAEHALAERLEQEKYGTMKWNQR